RHGQILFRLRGFSDSLEPSDALFVGVGYIIGERAGMRIPVIEGLPQPRSEDQLKALGAVAASYGSVSLFAAVGITPEAPTINDAFGSKSKPEAVFDIGPQDIRIALDKLSTVPDGAPLAAVSLGTPHFSFAEFQALIPMLAGFRAAAGVRIYIN